MSTNEVWSKTTKEKLLSLLADEAKNAAILDATQQTLKQLRAKCSFRLALLNQLLDELDDKYLL
jgi:hypothetical protein